MFGENRIEQKMARDVGRIADALERIVDTLEEGFEIEDKDEGGTDG